MFGVPMMTLVWTESHSAIAWISWSNSFIAYGYVCLINGAQADPMEVVVDRWPDFKVLFIRLKQQEADLFQEVSAFTTDEASLRNILENTDFFDWKQFFCLSVDACHEEMLIATAAARGEPVSKHAVCHMMTLHNPSNLTTDRLSVQVSSLNKSHIDLVKSTWKFGAEEFSKRMITNMIMNFPSCCVLDTDGQPVTWILTYPSCAIGMLYTRPEHRRKGYSKVVITALAQKLHSEGRPVFCFIEEENQVSYKLFTSLGFTEDPSYRFAWYGFSQKRLTPL